MASTWTRMKMMIGIAIPTSAVVLAIGGGVAWSTESCPSYASSLCSNVCYRVDGSDAMTEIVENAITASGACINYHNIGSDQAEKNMAGLSGATTSQGIGPMSRNLTPSVLAMPGFAPTDQNVIALDAGVMVVANIAGHCNNMNAALADPANPGIAQITTDLSIILSGYPAGGAGTKSKGTTAECAHPERLSALARLTSCMGVKQIEHIYRRDDKSGTQETFREHLQFDFWCNGRSEGNNGALGSNLLNGDLDPIRRPCTRSSSTMAATVCIYYPLTTTCNAGSSPMLDPTYGTINCTQGLIVALSENDPGAKDITISIGNRVAQDLNGYTIGFAGLAAISLQGQPTVGTNINTVSYDEKNIRAGQYMFSRRLFLQKKMNYVDPIGEPGRKAQEDILFNWVTNRCNMVSIDVDAGFLPPLASCSDICTDPLNITCLSAEAGSARPKQNIGAETTLCGPNNLYPCVADGIIRTSGSCPLIPVLESSYACDQREKCASGTCNINMTGLTGICQ